MRKFFVFVVLFFTLNSTFAQEYYKINEAIIGFNSTGYLLLSGNFELLNLTIRLVPQSYKFIEHTGSLTKDKYENTVFMKSYKSPRDRIDWYINSIAVINNTIPKLNHSYSFPYTNYPESIKKYLTWDYDEKVARKASEIVEGANDYYDAILRLFNWVHENIKYDESFDYRFSTINITPSYVLESKKSVCVGFSSLFIAFLRSVGIPAKYVFGFSASGNEMKEHSWVEVYVPEHGFIEFDPTYGEFGYVDASHVKLYSDSTSTVLETSYQYRTYASILNSTYNVSYSFLDYATTLNLLKLNVSLSKEKASSDDYILLILKIENPTRYYTMTSAMIEKTKELELIYGKEILGIVISPYSSRNVYYILHTPKNLDPDYIYVHPITLFVFGAKEINLNLTVDPNIKEKTRIDEIVIPTENLSSRHDLLSTEVSISPNETAFPPDLILKIRNIGNTILDDVKVKINYEKYVYNYTLGVFLINQEKSFKYKLELPNKTGQYAVNITVYYSNKTDLYESNFILREKTIIEEIIELIHQFIEKIMGFFSRKAY
jgi:transglutaminase-like putative cysteine protease